MDMRMQGMPISTGAKEGRTTIIPVVRSHGFMEDLELHLSHFLLQMKRPMQDQKRSDDSKTELDDV